MKSEALTDLYAVLTAGGRNSGERSQAVESKYYGRRGDPANHFEYPAEVERKKKLKSAKKLNKGR